MSAYNMPDDVSLSHPNFSEPTHCGDCERRLDDDLLCEACDYPCATCQATTHKTADHDQEADPVLRDYATAEFVRTATPQEHADSVEASERDGGRGVIRVDSRLCYVIEGDTIE